MSDSAPSVEGRFPNAPSEIRKTWFLDHVDNPPREIQEFLSGTSVDLAGSRILDVGCGDGFIDLGMMSRFHPYQLTGTDIFDTDVEELRRLSIEHFGVDLPDNIRFSRCSEDLLPFADASFDFVMSWSVFEHVSDPVRVLSEIRRVLRPRGYMFLQIWPLFHSQRGSHLWKWYSEGWEHLTRPHDELVAELAEMEKTRPELLKATMVDFQTLNRITLTQLQAAISTAGLKIRRVSASADTIDIPERLLRYPIVDLMLSEVKILAVRD